METGLADAAPPPFSCTNTDKSVPFLRQKRWNMWQTKTAVCDICGFAGRLDGCSESDRPETVRPTVATVANAGVLAIGAAQLLEQVLDAKVVELS